MKTTPSKPIFGGVPTAPDVRALREEYPESEMEPGDIATYEEVAALIDVEIDSHRYETVTGKWRDCVFADTGIVIGRSRGRFYMLSESEKLQHAGGKIRSGVRSVRKGGRVAAVVDAAALTSEERKRLQHTHNRTAALLLAARLRKHPEAPKLTE